jgi:hypothetical protein
MTGQLGLTERLDLIGPDPAPKTVCSISEYQMMDKSKKQVISSVIHYFQNPSELTFVLVR